MRSITSLSLIFFTWLTVSSCTETREYGPELVLQDRGGSSDIMSKVGDVIPGVVQIYSVNDRSEGLSKGSGVVIERTSKGSLILTARHMTEGDGVASWVVRKGGMSAAAELVRRGESAEEDWALLATSYPIGDAVPLLDSDRFRALVQPYAECLAVGFALGWNTVTVTSGHIQEKGDLVRMSAPIIFGNSGGGLFVLDGDRLKLAGITVAVGTSGMGTVATHMGISVGIDVIRRRGGLSR